MERKVNFEIRGNIAYITLNRPDLINALDPELCVELLACINTIANDENVRVVCLSGNGNGFCSGLDLKAFSDNPDKPSEILNKYFHPVILSLYNLKIPVVGKLQGIAAGAGASLLLTSDIILASENGAMSFSFVKIGLIPDCGSSWFLKEKVGYNKAFELFATGRNIKAVEALNFGLVNQVVNYAELDEKCEAICRKLVQGPGIALRLIKNNLKKISGPSLQEVLDIEAKGQDIAGGTDDFHEGVKAFVEKRPPVFKGR